MRIYIGYLLAGLLTFYLVMLYYGVSAGFASYVPILALVGAMVLFVLAAPVLVYNTKVGLYLGVAGCLLQLPYSLVFLAGIVEEAQLRWPLLLAVLPATLVLLSSYWTGKALLQTNRPVSPFPTAPALKFVLCVIPILFGASYVFSIRAYVSWSMFTPW
jgi:hypothetical protein